MVISKLKKTLKHQTKFKENTMVISELKKTLKPQKNLKHQRTDNGD